MTTSAPRDARALLVACQRQGCDVRRTSSGHLRITRDGRYVTTLACTLSDKRRGLRNAVAEARRAGIVLAH